MVPSSLVYASVLLTSDGTIPTANDTVTVGSKVYTFKATVTTVDGEVSLVSGTAAGALAALKAAINLSGVVAANYGSATVVNPDVCATTLTSTTLLLVSKVPGTVGNFIPSSEAGTHTSMGNATLGGGTGGVAGVGSIATFISEALAGMQLNAAVAQLLKEYDGDPTAD